MNLERTIKGLLRRWYVLVAGLLLAVGAFAGVWLSVPAQYERSSTQLLLPGRGSIPPGSENPLLYIGGLGLAADVVVRATGSENMAREIEADHPGVTFKVGRDPTTPGPVVLISVRASTDEQAGVVLDRLMEQTVNVMQQLQDSENISERYRITVLTTTRSDQGIPKDRTRLILSGAAGVAIVGLSVLVAALLEGIAGRRRAKRFSQDPGRHAEAPDLTPASVPEDPLPVIVAPATEDVFSHETPSTEEGSRTPGALVDVATHSRSSDGFSD